MARVVWRLLSERVGLEIIARVCKVYTKSKKEHESHLKMNLDLLKKEKCYDFQSRETHQGNRDVAWLGLTIGVKRDGVWRCNLWLECGFLWMILVDYRIGGRKYDGRNRNWDVDVVRKHGVVRILTFREVEIGESKMIGLELEQETTKVIVIKERLKKAKDRQKRVKLIVEMKLLGFIVGDHVMMKVSPWKGVVRFDNKSELAPRSSSGTLCAV
ncbi:hypothetical protein Tco_0167856 [Tanacetum coccineum]